MKWNNSITVSMYQVYKISIEFFSLECWDWFSYTTHTLSHYLYSSEDINKLQENYFSTVSQCLPYLTATAVTHPNAPIWDVYGWKYYCYVLWWLKNIIILFCEFNSLLLFGFSMFFDVWWSPQHTKIDTIQSLPDCFSAC